MTEHDLSTLVREHVSSDEPPFAGPAGAIAGGRRAVRHRRLIAGVGVAAVLAVAGAIVVPQVSGSDDSLDRPTGIDPATQEALDNYDASEMPRILDEASRAIFSRSVPELGEAEFFAGDGQGQELPAEHFDKASGMSVSYGGDSERQLSVDLSHSRGEAEGDAQEYCDEGLADGYYLECTVASDADGDTVISKFWALRGVNGEWSYVVDAEKLATIDPDKLWFEHSVKVIKSATFVTYVSETVKAPDQETAAGLFEVPVEDLVALGTDPRLVIPHPPADEESGCPEWLLPGSDVTCMETPVSPSPL
jgi:hypothetical protein